MDKDSKNISQDSMQSLSTELSNLATRIGGSTDRLVGVGNNLITSLEKQSKAQGRHEKAIIALTIVIALAAILSTYKLGFRLKQCAKRTRFNANKFKQQTRQSRAQ